MAVTPWDPIWLVISSSGVAISITNCLSLLTYLRAEICRSRRTFFISISEFPEKKLYNAGLSKLCFGFVKFCFKTNLVWQTTWVNVWWWFWIFKKKCSNILMWDGNIYDGYTHNLLRNLQSKMYNRFTIAKVVNKSQMSCFFEKQCTPKLICNVVKISFKKCYDCCGLLVWNRYA